MSEMECSCSCELWGEGDPIDNMQEEVVVLAEAKRCIECEEVLPPASEANRITGTMYDKVTSFEEYECVTCQRIRKTLCECTPIGMLREELKYGLGFDYVTGEDFCRECEGYGWKEPCEECGKKREDD